MMEPQRENLTGTVHIIDQGAHAGMRHADQKSVILFPIPTSDPEDPLNWSVWRKHYNLILLCYWCFMAGAAVIGPSSAFPNIMADVGISADDISLGQALCILFMGFSNIVWVSLAKYIGRRPVYLLATLIMIGSQIFTAKITNRSQYIGSRILTGIAAALFEGLPATYTSDVFFVHERALKIGFYFMSAVLGTCFGPLWVGHLSENTSLTWRWHGWIMAIIYAELFIQMLFTLDESKYDRDYNSELSMVIAESTQVEIELQKAHDILSVKDATSLDYKTDKNSRFTFDYWAAKLSLIRLSSPQQNSSGFWATILETISLLRLPIIIWGGVTVGIGVAMATEVNNTLATIMELSPYNWKSSKVGDSWMAQAVAAIISVPSSGFICDKVALRMAKKNNGLWESEFRLLAMIPALVLLPGGLLIYGLTAYYKKHWIGIQIGSAVIQMGYCIVSEVVLSYCLEAYKPVSLEAYAALMTYRNTIAFGLVWSVSPWSSHGYAVLCGYSALLCFGVILFTLPMYIWGKRCRIWSSKSWPISLKKL